MTVRLRSVCYLICGNFLMAAYIVGNKSHYYVSRQALLILSYLPEAALVVIFIYEYMVLA